MNDYTVSVLIPTWRRPQMLARAIRSVQAQTWRDLTIVVHDNASDDGTSAMVTEMALDDPRIVYLCHGRNIGATANIRNAIAQVATSLFCLVSDDDILLPNCLEDAVAGLRAHPRMMAWSGIVISATDAWANSVRPWPPWPPGPAAPALACLRVARDSRPETTGMVFRREVITQRFLGDRPGFVTTDVGWVLEAAKLGGIGHTPRPSAVFYQHAGSLSTGAGASYNQAMRLYWPSVRHLLDQFAEACPLPDEIASACLGSIRLHFGVKPLRRCAAAALISADREALAACCASLAALGDGPGLARLAALAAVPLSRARLDLHLGRQASLLRRLATILRRRAYAATLSALSRRYLALYTTPGPAQ